MGQAAGELPVAERLGVRVENREVVSSAARGDNGRRFVCGFMLGRVIKGNFESTPD